MHLGRVELLIPYHAGQVADIIGYLQAAEDAKQIDYYSLSQTSLDSVSPVFFLLFFFLGGVLYI